MKVLEVRKGLAADRAGSDSKAVVVVDYTLPIHEAFSKRTAYSSFKYDLVLVLLSKNLHRKEVFWFFSAHYHLVGVLHQSHVAD